MSADVQADAQQHPSMYFTDDFRSEKVACLMPNKTAAYLLERNSKIRTTKSTDRITLTFFLHSYSVSHKN